MTRLLFDAPEVKTVPVRGEDARYPVRRIFCVGRNYAAHAAEMGTEVDREAPFYFTKSSTTLTPSGATIPYPPGTANFHYEMELVLALGVPVFKAGGDEAMAAIWGFACGLDMTRRDLQIAERQKQRPGISARMSRTPPSSRRSPKPQPLAPSAASASISRSMARRSRMRPSMT